MVKPRKPFFERLKTGLEEGIAYGKGEHKLKTFVMPEGSPLVESSKRPSLSKKRKRR